METVSLDGQKRGQVTFNRLVNTPSHFTLGRKRPSTNIGRGCLWLFGKGGAIYVKDTLNKPFNLGALAAVLQQVGRQHDVLRRRALGKPV